MYIDLRLFKALAVLAVLYLLSFWFTSLFPIANLLLLVLALLFVMDLLALYGKGSRLEANRLLPEKFSNSDPNDVPISIQNNYTFTTHLDIIDEIPVQFQKRDFKKELTVGPRDKTRFIYSLRPTERGEYIFGNLNIYASSRIKLVKRRYQYKKDQLVKVYPSFIQMKKYAFMAMDNKLNLYGMKKIRRIGHTMDFEQIKDYILGDDVRTINWKATAKRASLMVNQFQDEKSQPVYTIIDASRVMKMPFKGLTLLDYAINSTLAFSNIALKKKDKVGLLTFAENIKNHLPANSKKTHLNTILEVLYNINTKFLDSDFSTLYNQIKRKINHRSLLLLYTNFEHISSLERQMRYLQALSRKHILVVIFFKNTELDTLLAAPSKDIPEIYHKTIAQKADYDKKLMVQLLERHGIQAILTKPENLTVNTINKYLEIKARGIL